MNRLRLSRLSRALRTPAGSLLATLGLAGALASPGIAANLTEAVRHYEVALGFEYTKQEREDLVAFLEAL